MLVTTVAVFVKAEHIDDFIEATKRNHERSVEEPGNMRFDVLQCTDDPSRFLLYEAYESREAAAAHKKTEHYNTWRETVADMMARPREGVPHRIVCPADRSRW